MGNATVDLMMRDLASGVPESIVLGYARRHLAGVEALPEGTDGRADMIEALKGFIDERGWVEFTPNPRPFSHEAGRDEIETQRLKADSASKRLRVILTPSHLLRNGQPLCREWLEYAHEAVLVEGDERRTLKPFL